MDARTAFAWILVVALAAITWLLVEPFLSWLLVTGLVAFVLNPVHRRLERRIGAGPSAGRSPSGSRSAPSPPSPSD